MGPVVGSKASSPPARDARYNPKRRGVRGRRGAGERERVCVVSERKHMTICGSWEEGGGRRRGQASMTSGPKAKGREDGPDLSDVSLGTTDKLRRDESAPYQLRDAKGSWQVVLLA